MFLEKDGVTLRITAAFIQESPEKMRFSMGEGIAERCLNQGKLG
jgi:hypothetical protein